MSTRKILPPLPDTSSNDLAQRIEFIPVASLVNHPRNYRDHPDDQVAHLVDSLQRFGFYRNIVIAADNVLLAGHGVLQAAQELGIASVPVLRMPFPSDHPEALALLVGDNEVQHLAMNRDRELTELLKELSQDDPALLRGTGYDETMLAALAMVTRPGSEIKDTHEAEHWVGMPTYGEPGSKLKLILSFETVEARVAFLEQIALPLPGNPARETLSSWWPPKAREDLSALQFEG